MESVKLTEELKKLQSRLIKLKYPALILAVGILLLLLPSGKAGTTEPKQETEVKDSLALEASRIEAILSQVKGAGEVKILLSWEEGGQTEYARDTEAQTQTDENGSSLRESSKTVLYTAGSGTQSPLVAGTTAPTYRGAVIVCQGAEDASVRLALTQAVASLTGLGANQIVIMKMK